MYELIVARGRVGDRTPGAVRGAELLGNVLAARLGCGLRQCGRPEAARVDGYSEALTSAATSLRELAAAVAAAYSGALVPVVAGNKCPVGLATIPVAAERHPDLAVVWFDAHGDFHTPATTASSYLGGMVLSAVCGLWSSGHGAGVDPRNVVLVGARDIDPAESQLLEQAGVTILPPEHSTPDRLARFVGNRSTWVHLDLDVLEPGFVPGDYAVPGGLMPHEVRGLLEALDPLQAVGLELTEFEAPLVETARHAGGKQALAAPDARTAAALQTVMLMLEPLLP